MTPRSAVIVRELRHEAHDVVSLTLVREDGGELPPWTAGAHIDVELPTGLRRSYSLCGDPSSTRTYRIAVHREAGSRGASEYVHMYLRPGQVLHVSEPRNHFPLVDASRYWFVAGGIGITPVLTLAREVSGRAPFTLLYLGRGASTFAFREELAQLEGSVVVHDSLVLGRCDLRTALVGVGAGTAVFACGPEQLLEALDELAAQWPAGTLHTERFHPRTRVASPRTAFEVVWQPDGTTSPVPATRSALEAMEESRLPVTGSCREGVCGTCEVVVVGGVPEHLDDVVEDHAVEGGERFYPCVSRALSPTLVVRPS